MSASSVIILSNNTDHFIDLSDFLQKKEIDVTLTSDLSKLNPEEIETFFNPILLIDLDDTIGSALNKLVERAQQQHMSYFFVTGDLSSASVNDIKVLKPAGYFTKPLDHELVFLNIEQELFNISTSHFKNKKLEELFVKSGKDYIRIGSDDILWIQASGNYIEIFTSYEKSYLLRIGLKDIEGRLPEEQFIRVHKSYIVNKKHILKFNSHSIKTAQGELPLARSYFNTVLTAFTVI